MLASCTLEHAAVGDSVEEIDRRRADEARDEQGVGTLVEIIGGALLLDPAAVHHHDPVGHRRRFDLIVSDEDRRHAELALDAADLGAHREPQPGVEVRQRLVEQQQMRPLDQGAGERHALLLAAGKLARPPIEQDIDAHERGDLARAALGVGPFDRLEAQREHDVVEHRHVGIERVGLEHDADIAAPRLDVVDPRAVERDLAARRLVDPREHHQCRRLAAA